MLRTSGAAVDFRRVAVTCFNLTNAILDPWTYLQPGLRTKMRIGTRERGLTWSNVTGSGMAALTPVEEDSLLSPEDLQAQSEWDQEFQRRKEDLARQQLKSRERRRAVSDKMAELRDRWQVVERRRQLRSREGGRTDNSMTLNVPNSHSTGSHPGNNGVGENHGNMIDGNKNNDSRETSSESYGLNR